MPILEDPDPLNDGLYLTGGLLELDAGLYSASDNTTAVQWRSLIFAGQRDSADYVLRDLVGWEELPPYNTTKTPVGGGHGTLVSPLQYDERVVTVTGWCYNQTARDGLMATFQRECAPGVDGFATEQLIVYHASRVLSADARLVAYDTVPEAGWALGRFGWRAQWLCNDPFRYGGWQTITSTLAQPSAGLALPTSLPAAFPPSVPGGLFPATNDGTALAPAIYTLPGPMTSPGVLLNSGTAWQQIVQYDLTLVEGDSLVIDTAKGSGLFNGEYRPPSGTSGLTKNLALRPGVNTVQALGNVVGTPDPWPSITCSFRPAYW